MTTSAFERIIRPIVEGQIRGFLMEHPKIVEAVDWYKPRKDKSVTFLNSMSKRIVRDLVSANCHARIRAALLECSAGSAPNSTMASGHCGEAAASEITVGCSGAILSEPG